MDMTENWGTRSEGMICKRCIWFALEYKAKESEDEKDRIDVLGGCRKHAPTISGWPVVMSTGWCGDHKLDEYKVVGEG